MKYLLFSVASLVVAATSTPVSNAPRVDIQDGSFIGTSEELAEGGGKIEEFLGIPYARPPVGELRFALPQPIGAVGVVNATKFGPSCSESKDSTQMSEDCLTLNVFRKAGTTKGDNKPVIVIFHGSLLGEGASSHPGYFPGFLVGLGDVVAVNFNYRLGILGFGDMKHLAPGNLGLHDQRLVLEWIQDNIRSFGGDPDKVTLMGTSTGSMAVSAQIMTPLNRGQGRKLFHAAIMDGGVLIHATMPIADQSLTRMKRIAKELNCSTDGPAMVDCLRKVDVHQLLPTKEQRQTPQNPFDFYPTLDNEFLPKDLVAGGHDFTPVKVMIGTAKDEGSIFAAVAFFAKSLLPGVPKERFSEWIAQISSFYKLPTDLTNDKAKAHVSKAYYEKENVTMLDMFAFVGDGLIVCPVNAFIKAYPHSHQKVYVYRFEQDVQQSHSSGGASPLEFGVPHTTPFVHMLGAFKKGNPVDAKGRAYVSDLIRTVTDFARSAEAPKFRGLQWQDFSKGEGVMVFDDESHVVADLTDEDNCQKVFPSIAFRR